MGMFLFRLFFPFFKLQSHNVVPQVCQRVFDIGKFLIVSAGESAASLCVLFVFQLLRHDGDLLQGEHQNPP